VTDPDILPLEPQQLHHACDPSQFGFQTTAELEGLTELIGQVRAMDAVRFGAGIRRDGYNIYVLGPSGMGKRSMVQQFLSQKAGEEAGSFDWCYINNFTHPHQPQAIQLPSTRGAQLQQHMARVVDYLRSAIPALFESDDYREKTQVIQQEFNKRQDAAFKQLGEEAGKNHMALLRTQGGFAFAPVRNDEVIPPDEYAKLSDEEREQITTTIAQLQERLETILKQIPQWWKERSERIMQLNRETTQLTVNHVIDELRTHFLDLPEVLQYLDAVQKDMIENADDFRKQEESTSLSGITVVTRESFHRYQVNVLVTNGKQTGAPIVSEENPTYSNLIGRVEHIAQLGALVTDFTLIKPGALHRANGGYLLLDIRKVLMQPFAWDGLKRALQSGEIRIESLGQMYSLVSTVSLEPQPISLDVKIVLFGDRLLYYLLQEYDPDFGELFKVAADFEDRMERTTESHGLYARLVATLCAKEKLLPFDRGAVARVVEHSARLVGDAQRLSTHMRSIADLLQESDYWAHQSAAMVVTAEHVQRAIDTQISRQDRIRKQLQEAILRGTLMIDTTGAIAGQINGLSVIDLGGFAFAQPIRITATSRLGDGEMVNIEREVKLSGAIHSKGVLILSAFLAARYARSQLLALTASLVFEQSYGQVEGDSASLAELCALLSNLANAPIRQSLGVTGSVNQFGQVQAIGAVNEKIEGFFDICAARGLSGDQGVLIPSANVKHLMLRHDVVAAVAAGKFWVYAVDTVDQAITILTGEFAGPLGADGQYPESSINYRVANRISELADIRKALVRQPQRHRVATDGFD
jgi:lon-related putative ATP-dependent protease